MTLIIDDGQYKLTHRGGDGGKERFSLKSGALYVEFSSVSLCDVGWNLHSHTDYSFCTIATRDLPDEQTAPKEIEDALQAISDGEAAIACLVSGEPISIEDE